MENEFIKRLREVTLENISNDQFGVSELANAVGMSRSNLLRRIQKDQECSASQFIRQVRLEEAMILLKEKDKTVSEISFMVGFSSSSYFIKCFREHYGYSPGEVGKEQQAMIPSESATPPKYKYKRLIAGSIVIILAVVLFFIIQRNTETRSLERSIAVLPFKNDSSDSTNIYVINGLMESILNNLQSLNGLKVISRTSVEKFRESHLTIPEIAKELNVNYIVEGSGQKVGDQILLSVQLIQADKDDHLWSKQYNRELKDIFYIQSEVAKKIADAIQIIISPEEQEQIEQIPTENLVAYDYFLKGIDQLNKETENGLRTGIEYFRKAISEDEEFARANAALALAYYYLDMFNSNKHYTDSLIFFTDKALLYNPKLAQGLTAKALYYIRIKEYDQAVEYLEKALVYNPNSAIVINTLSDIYTNYLPNTEQYLTYALKGISLDIASHDSLTASYIYLHLSNALVQNGFTNKSLKAINKSLEFNPNNLFSVYVKAYILYAINKDLDHTKNLLVEAFKRDTTRFDILQEIGNVCYYQQNWEEAFLYFNSLLEIREQLGMALYIHKNAEIAFTYRIMGKYIEAENLISEFKSFADSEKSIYKNLYLSSYYAYMDNQVEAIKHLKLFAEKDNIQFWVPLFTPNDPIYDNFKDNPEFVQVFKEIEKRFWDNHRRLKKKLVEENLIKILE